MSETKTKKGHGCLIGIIVFIIFVGAITFGIIQTIEHPELYEEKSKVEEAVGCSQEEAESIEDVLNKCDITDYQDVKADEGLNGAWKKNDKGFRIEIQDGMEVLMWLWSRIF